MLQGKQDIKQARDDGQADGSVQQGVGAMLRARREEYGLDLRDIANMLRIRYPYLVAIEEGRLDELPGATYAVGFVRAYADHLGLDGQAVVERYKDETAALAKSAQLVFPSPLPEGKVPSGTILLVAILALVAIYGGWVLLSTDNRRLAEIVPAIPDRLLAMVGLAEDDAAQDQSSPAVPAQPERASQPAESPASKPDADKPAVAKPESPAPQTAETEPAQPAPVSAPPATENPGAAPETTPAPAAPRPETIASATPSPVNETASTPSAEPATATDQPPAPANAGAAAAAPVTPDAVTSTGEPPQPSAAAEDQGPDRAAGAEPAATQDTARVVEASPSGAAEPPAAGQSEEQPAEPRDPAAGESPPVTAAPSPESTVQAVVEAVEPAQTPPAAVAALDNVPPAPPAAGAKKPRQYGIENADARVVIRATSDSWVQVRDSEGKLLLTRVLRVGDSYLVPNDTGLVMRTGNAGGLDIRVDGEPVPELGPKGAIRHNVALDAELLKAGTAIRR